LLLTEEQWQAQMKDKQPDEGSSKSDASKGGGKNRPHNQKKKKNIGGGKDDRNTCHTYGKKGHWAKDCRAS
jgi:hypothetical protein